MPTLSFDKRILDTVLAVVLVRYQEMADVAHPAAAPQEQAIQRDSSQSASTPLVPPPTQQPYGSILDAAASPFSDMPPLCASPRASPSVLDPINLGNISSHPTNSEIAEMEKELFGNCVSATNSTTASAVSTPRSGTSSSTAASTIDLATLDSVFRTDQLVPQSDADQKLIAEMKEHEEAIKEGCKVQPSRCHLFGYRNENV